MLSGTLRLRVCAGQGGARQRFGGKSGKMRNILVVIDMQNDFIDGALGTQEAQAIVGTVVEKIKAYPKSDVYATRDTHGADYLDTAEGKKLPVEHCICGTKGWEIHPDIARLLEPSHIVDKPTFGSLVLTRLLEEENKQEEIQVELVGLCTDICVVSNALLLKAALPENTIYVDASCCAGVTPKSHEAALMTMEMCQVGVV